MGLSFKKWLDFRLGTEYISTYKSKDFDQNKIEKKILNKSFQKLFYLINMQPQGF